MQYLNYIMLVAMFMSACANKDAAKNDNESQQNTIANVLSLPTDYIINDKGLKVNGYNELATSYMGYGDDGKTYALHKEHLIIEEPSIKSDEVISLSWPQKGGQLVEVQTIKKFVPKKQKEDADAQYVMAMDDEEIDEEIHEDMFIDFGMKDFNGNKFSIKHNNFNFEGTALGQNIIKSVFSINDGKKANITFYPTKAVYNQGYAKAPVQAVTVKFKDGKEEIDLFVKVVKVDNPNFEYFVIGCDNREGLEAPDDFTLDFLAKHPSRTGIIDNGGNLWLRKN